MSGFSSRRRIISCAESNAGYGYGVKELFNSNATVRDIMKADEGQRRMIELAGLIGWNLCAEDMDEANKCWREFKEEVKARGYAK